ncbi:hypothetical protein HYE67_008431 [Fusarium culmorum]|uniref:Uncharacterized protein n=1 Tax=Fusarium culmorum TaxID=5516 RepID=A0A2T4H9Q9_FUSCU|nr:hypothetical protein FCULG_00003125 [Fusarium culmorum]QPC66200.1 hypothetical protein HYE67_008431 [Fusarium culmorum]
MGWSERNRAKDARALGIFGIRSNERTLPNDSHTFTTTTRRSRLLGDTQVTITTTTIIITRPRALHEPATRVSQDGPTATAHAPANVLSTSAVDRLERSNVKLQV